MYRAIGFSPPDINEDDIKAVTDVLRSGWITTGSIAERLENIIKQYLDAPYALALNSATAGLFLALKAYGVGEGDEVITTPYTFAATANVIMHTGAKPVFADTAPGSFFISAKNIEAKLSPRTKAVIPVDYAGALPQYNSILEVVERAPFHADNAFQESLRRPLVLADSAHSLGAHAKGSFAGDVQVFSFHAVKNLTTAEGGMLVFHSLGAEEIDASFNKLLRLYALHGQDKSAREKFLSHSWEYDISVPGYKYNMPDTLAALGLSQFQRYDSEILPLRRSLFDAYSAHLDKNAFIIPDFPKNHSAHLYPLRLACSMEKRNKMIQKLSEIGISTNVHYKPLTLMSSNSYYQSTPCPQAEEIWKDEISLPIHGKMTIEDAVYITDQVKNIRAAL